VWKGLPKWRLWVLDLIDQHSGKQGNMGVVVFFCRTASRFSLSVLSPHLLAPTASDLRKWGKLNTILAGFHTDLNFLFEAFADIRRLK